MTDYVGTDSESQKIYVNTPEAVQTTTVHVQTIHFSEQKNIT
jgi:hypothetical protein